MAEFTLIVNDNSEADLIVACEDQKMDSLMSDEVVLDWLGRLESDSVDGSEALQARL